VVWLRFVTVIAAGQIPSGIISPGRYPHPDYLTPGEMPKIVSEASLNL